MPVLKSYNSQTAQWDSIVVGSSGPQGAQGAQGAQGPQGPQGIAGAVVVTSSTRPNSPSDGLMIYETDTDRIAVYDGSSWVYKTNATAPDLAMAVMLSPTSVAGTGVSLSGGKVSFTSASSVSVNGCFSSAYSKYRIIINPKYSSTSDTLRMRFRANGTDNSSAYFTHSIYTTQNGGPSRAYDSNLSNGYIGWVADISWDLNMEVHNPFAADYTSWTSLANGIGSNSAVVGTLWGMHNVQSSFDGFTIFPPSGSITGSLRIYGYRESI